MTSVMGGGVGGEGSKPRHIIRMCGGRGVNPGTLLGLSNVECAGRLRVGTRIIIFYCWYCITTVSTVLLTFHLSVTFLVYIPYCHI